jgi:hypothetical protein
MKFSHVFGTLSLNNSIFMVPSDVSITAIGLLLSVLFSSVSSGKKIKSEPAIIETQEYCQN